MRQRPGSVRTECPGRLFGPIVLAQAVLSYGERLLQAEPGSVRSVASSVASVLLPDPGRLFGPIVLAQAVLSHGGRLLQAEPGSVRSFASSVAPILLPEPALDFSEELSCPVVGLVLAF